MARVRRALLGLTLAIACVVASPTVALAHHGMPMRVVADRVVGPYVVSVWATPEVGEGMVYVVYAPRDGASFVAPRAVRVSLAPMTGGASELVHMAHAESVRHGARFVAHVQFDRADAWRVRVVTDGPLGGGEVIARVDVGPMAAMGPMGLLLYSLPFVAVAALWSRVIVARRRAANVSALLTSP